jgi:hypothetical protein
VTGSTFAIADPAKLAFVQHRINPHEGDRS